MESRESHQWGDQEVHLLYYDRFGTLTNFDNSLCIPFWCQEGAHSHVFSSEQTQSFLSQPKELVLLPLPELDGERLGHVAFSNIPPNFEPEKLEDFGAYCTAAALAISRAGRSRRIERTDQELHDAWNVLKTILPPTPLTLAEIELSGLLIPAREISGDIFDFFEISDSKIGFVIADATGKGPGPCLQAASCRAYLRALLSRDAGRLEDVARALNNLLYQDLKSEKFVTSCFGWIDVKRSLIQYVNAGHGCGFHRHQHGVDHLGESDLPLGILADVDFRVFEMVLEQNDYLILFTDGWAERLTNDGLEYGEQGLEDSLPWGQESGASVMRQAFQAYSIACRSSLQADDVTGLVIYHLA